MKAGWLRVRNLTMTALEEHGTKFGDLPFVALKGERSVPPLGPHR